MKAVILPIKCALLLLLFFHLLPTSICQKELLHEIQGWNYRDGERVNIQGLKSITRMLEKWGNSIFEQMKYSLLSHPNTLLPELSSLRPVSEAIDNLLKQVHSMKKRLASLNERLNLMSRALFPIQYKAVKSQRLSSVRLRRLPRVRRRMYLQRQTQRN
ncbi:uncharacterized protein LOC143838233 isoform X2 [Paroedura picta]|uniref:uncharacterized protein LOC143838233 isoform X2 n=1 Tax=Paroedura picta TaxID=143630 RepID=UPI0040568F88